MKTKTKQYLVHATVTVSCVRSVYAIDEDDARDQCDNMSGEEWLNFTHGPEIFEIDDVELG